MSSTIADARRHDSVGRFLLANMVYQDALVALFAFGGIYGAGVFGWQAIELGIFGILLTVTGTLGALIGGRLDDRIGAKPVILGAIRVLALVCVGMLSLGREHILFVVPTAPPAPDDGLYGSAPEKMFLAARPRHRRRRGPAAGLVAQPARAPRSRAARRAAISACWRSRAKSRPSSPRSRSPSPPRSSRLRQRDRRC